MHVKIFSKNIMTSSRFRSFDTYDFLLNDFIDKNLFKGHTFKNFSGHSMTSEVKGHFYIVVDNPVKFINKIKCCTVCLVACFLKSVNAECDI